MIIRICAFTLKGWELADKIEESFKEHIFERRSTDIKLDAWARDSFFIKAPIIFIGAAGIAVRAIAGSVSDKLTDSPVLVIDQSGKYVIPILSGHVGGANRLALEIGERLSMIPVITTATDVNSSFSVDEFAVANRLTIVNREGIRRVASKILETGSITMSISPDIDSETLKADNFFVDNNIKLLAYPPENRVDLIISGDDKLIDKAELFLKPKEYILGIGCKRGSSEGNIRKTVEEVLAQYDIDINSIAAIGTIDIKEREYGLCAYAQKEKIPLLTFSAQELETVEGNFAQSEFVKSVTGVSNVCERAAVCGAIYYGGDSDNTSIIIPKRSGQGITIALARRKVKLISG
ncbi:MAG: cobalamin biosynthesis protein [Eubacterium sp.]|nr:cobalamin biosynthesis protein [Eubacterium sp.]